ncbi:MAG TPA: aldehyde dehydrogenase family protein, partial [Candidatus Limnocylindrales bacterium]
MTTTAPPASATDWIARATALRPAGDLFIDGRRIPASSGRTYADIAGRDGAVIGHIAEGDADDVDRAVTAARRAFDDGRWADRSPADRKAVLLSLAARIRDELDELALLEALDGGKPIRDTLAVDVPSAADTFQWYGEA